MVQLLMVSILKENYLFKVCLSFFSFPSFFWRDYGNCSFFEICICELRVIKFFSIFAWQFDLGWPSSFFPWKLGKGSVNYVIRQHNKSDFWLVNCIWTRKNCKYLIGYSDFGSFLAGTLKAGLCGVFAGDIGSCGWPVQYESHLVGPELSPGWKRGVKGITLNSWVSFYRTSLWKRMPRGALQVYCFLSHSLLSQSDARYSSRKFYEFECLVYL